jgi:predicted Zn-dependent protease
LFGAAKKVVDGAARVAADGTDEAEIKSLIETTADGVRAGLAVADEALPPLNPKDAKAFGDSFRQSLLAEHKPIADRKTKDLIMPIWTAVLRASKQPDDSVTLTLLEDKENNAFAFVGRNIVVNRGFVAFASECTHAKEVIRFTLAHELGHIVHGHTDSLFRRMMAADKVVHGGGVAPLVVETIIRQTPISQAAERQADCFARRLHIDNGWSLEGGKEFFTRVQSMSARSDSGMAIDSLFGSHPNEKRRLELLENGVGCDK